MLLTAFFMYLCLDGTLLELWKSDITKLSFLIMSIFGVMLGWCGTKYWKVSVLQDRRRTTTAEFSEVRRSLEVGWFVSDLFLTIGMIGTVIGFIWMLAGFATVDFNNVQTVQGLLSKLGSGMATALYTTLSGLVCSCLLKVQCFGLQQAVINDES